MGFVDYLGKKKKQAEDTFSSLGATARSYSDSLSKKARDYFRPTSEVRTRDFIREVPKATFNTGKSMFQGTYNVATKAPKIFGEGLAYATSKNVRDQYKAGNLDILPTISKTTPTSMLADTGRSMLEVATAGKGPKWATAPSIVKRTAFGAGTGYGFDVLGKVADEGKVTKESFKPGAGTVLGGVFGAAAKPTTEIVKEGVEQLQRGVNSGKKIVSQVPQAVRNSVENRRNPVVEVMPEHWVPSRKVSIRSDEAGRPDIIPPAPNGERYAGGAKPAGIDPVTQSPRYVMQTEKLIPEQRVSRPKTPTITDLVQQAKEAFPTPSLGMSIKAVGTGPTNKNTKAINAINAEKNAKASALVENMKRGEVKQPELPMIPKKSTPAPVVPKAPVAENPIDKFSRELDAIPTPWGKPKRQQKPVAEYEKLVNKRPLVPSPNTIGKVYDTFVNTPANKASALVPKADPLSVLPEGTSEIFRHEPTVTNYDTWLGAIGMNAKERKRVSFPLAQKLIHEWRVQNQPEYVGKQAEISKFKNFVAEFQNAQTTGIRRGKEYLEKFGVTDPAKQDQVIRALDQPGDVPSDIAPAVQALRNEQDSLFKEAQEAGLDVGYWKNYVTHIWAESPEEVAKKIRKGLQKGVITMDDISQGAANQTGTPYFGPATARILKTYEAGSKIGLHKLYNDPSQILAHYVMQLERAKVVVSNIKSLKESGLVVDGLHPGTKALTVQGAEGLSATPELADKINNAFKNHEYTTRAGKVLEYAAATSRKLKDLLMSGGIPASTVNSYGISMTLKEIGTLSPVRAWNAVSSFLVANNPNASRKFFTENLAQIEKIRRNDIQISTMLDKGGFVDNGIITSIFGSGTGKGFWGGAQAHWDAIINEPTFGRYLPMNQIKFFNSVESSLLEKGYPPQAAEWIASKELREGMGLGSAAKEAGKSQLWKDWRETLFFAPTHRMNMIRVFGNALKSFGRNPFTPGNQSSAQFLVGGMAVYAMYDWVNYKNTGHHLYDNPEGKKFEAYISTGDGDYISIPFMPSVATMPRLGIEVAERVAGGDISGGLGTAWQGTGSILSKPLADVAMNSDYFDRPIANENDEPGKQWLDRGKYLGKSYTGHPWLKAGIDAASGVPAEQILAQAVEAPVRFTTADKLATKNFWDEYNSVKPSYETFMRLVKTDPVRADEFYTENQDKIENYKKLDGLRGVYSDLKESGNQDQFGAIIKENGFAFDQNEGSQSNPSLSIINTARAEGAPENAPDASGSGKIYRVGENFYVPYLTSGAKTFKTEALAKRAIAQEDFDASGEQYKDMGDYVFVRDSEGKVTHPSKEVFTVGINVKRMNLAKDRDDTTSWKKYAEGNASLLKKMLENPLLNEYEQIELTDKYETVVRELEKFNEYGGAFTKPKTGRDLEEKYRYPLIDKDLMGFTALSKTSKPIIVKRPPVLNRRRMRKVRKARK